MEGNSQAAHGHSQPALWTPEGCLIINIRPAKQPRKAFSWACLYSHHGARKYFSAFWGPGSAWTDTCWQSPDILALHWAAISTYKSPLHPEPLIVLGLRLGPEPLELGSQMDTGQGGHGMLYVDPRLTHLFLSHESPSQARALNLKTMLYRPSSRVQREGLKYKGQWSQTSWGFLFVGFEFEYVDEWVSTCTHVCEHVCAGKFVCHFSEAIRLVFWVFHFPVVYQAS